MVLDPLVPAHPSPFVWVPFFPFAVSVSVWQVACHVSSRRVRRRGRGVSSSGHSAGVRSWWAAFCGLPYSGSARWSPDVPSAGSVGVASGVAWLGGCPPRQTGCAASRLCDCPPRLPSFPFAGRCALLGGRGFPPSVFFLGRRLPGPPLCPLWVGARTGRQTVWLTESPLAFWMAAGRASAPCFVWFLYTHGLVARPVRLGSGSAGWAVAPACFVGPWVGGMGLSSVTTPLWCRFCGGGLNFPVAVCAGGPPLAGGGGVVSTGVVGWCALVSRLRTCFLPFWGVRRLDRVRPTVCIPCPDAAVCFGVPCCAVLCFAVLRSAVLRCAVVPSALPCRAMPCRAMVSLAVACGSRRAVLCRAVSSCAVSCRGVSCCVALHGSVLCCGLLCCVVLCRALLHRGVWWVHCTSGLALVRLVASLVGTRAQVMWLGGAWGAWVGVLQLAASLLQGSGCRVQFDGSGGGAQGCPPLGPVPWSHVLRGSLSLGVCRVLLRREAWSPALSWVPSHPVSLPPCRPPSLVSRPCPPPPPMSVPLRLCGGPCCGRGRSLAVRVRWWVVRCSPKFPVRVYSPPPVWVYPPPVRGLVVGGRGVCEPSRIRSTRAFSQVLPP